MGLEILFAAGAAAFQAFAGAGFATFLVKTAVGVGLSLGLSAISSKKTKQAGQSAPTGVQLELATGADTPRSVVFNEAGTAGHLVWFKETGANNDTLHMNIVYSDGWCAPPRGVIVDGVEKALMPQTVTGTEHARYHVADFGSDIIVRWHDGRPGQAADSDMVAVSGGDITTDDVGEGLAYFSISIAIKEDGITSAPEFLWLGGGYRCYDLRKDSTVGGSGAHRRDDPTTWEPSGNPFVQFYNYAVGISAGSDSKALGGFADVDGLIGTTFMVAANVADEEVTTDGVTEPRYACSAILAADGEDHRGKVAGLLQAGAGWAVERGGQLGVLAGAAQTPVVTFTDDDLILGEEVEWSRDKERDERVNRVRGQFVSPAALYQLDDYPGIIDADARAADGERLEATLDLGTVQSPTQAQRIADIRLQESRLGRASVALPEVFLALQPGRWARWNSARHGNHLYRIEGHEDNDNGVIRLPLQRMTNAVYGGPSFGTYTPAPTPSLPPLAPSTVSGFELQVEVIAGDGSGLPVLKPTWTPPNDPRVDAVLVEYRIVGAIASQWYRQDRSEQGFALISDVAPAANYQVRLTISTTPSRNTTFTTWKSIKTDDPPLVIPDNSVSLSNWELSMQDALASFNRRLDQVERVAEVASTGATLGSLDSYQDGEAIRALLANYGEQTDARLVEIDRVVADEVSALASKAVLVEAEAGDAQATGLLKIESSVSPDGLTSSFGFIAQARFGDVFSQAGISVELKSAENDPSDITGRVLVEADQFFVKDGSTGKQLISVVDGNVFLKDIFAERVRSSPGLTDRGFDLNGLTGTFTMWATLS